MGNLVDFVTMNWQDILTFVTQVVGAFAILAAWTPNQADNRVAQMLADAVNFMGANVNKAANK
jgi:hypothetical protein